MAVAKFVARQTDWYELREAFPFLLIRNGKWSGEGGNTYRGENKSLYLVVRMFRAS